MYSKHSISPISISILQILILQFIFTSIWNTKLWITFAKASSSSSSSPIHPSTPTTNPQSSLTLNTTSDILNGQDHHHNDTIILSSSSPSAKEKKSKSSSDKIHNETKLQSTNTAVDEIIQEESADKFVMIKPKKQKNKPITKVSKPITKTPISATASKNSESLRRLKREWRDAVQLGVAYDWSKMKSVTPPSRPATQRTQIVRKTVQSYSNGRQTTTTTTSTITQYTSSQEYTSSSSTSTPSNSNHHYLRLGPIRGNLLRWHFSYTGPPGPKSPYATGIYHGCILLPKDYPLSPPRIQVLTPNGRFLPGKDICLTASQYHPESWTPRWTVLALVNALRLHMLTTENEIGGMRKTFEQRQKLAELSRRWKISRGNLNVDHGTMVPLFFQSESLAIEGSKTKEEEGEGKEQYQIETKEPDVEHENETFIERNNKKDEITFLTKDENKNDESTAYSDSETFIDLDLEESTTSISKPQMSSPSTIKSSKQSKRKQKRNSKKAKHIKSLSPNNSKPFSVEKYPLSQQKYKKTNRGFVSSFMERIIKRFRDPRQIMVLLLFTFLTLWNPLESFFQVQ